MIVKICLSEIKSAIYIGWKSPFNTTYVNMGIVASGITLKVEYYSSSGWTDVYLVDLKDVELNVNSGISYAGPHAVIENSEKNNSNIVKGVALR